MQKDIFDLSGKKILLTGGLGLLGMNFARSLLERGGILILLDLAEESEAKKILSSKFDEEYLSRIIYYKCDVTSVEQLQQTRKDIVARFGVIDVLINNAALNPKVEDKKLESDDNSFENLRLEDWNREISVNLTGTMLCCRFFGSVILAGSSIINISSIYGLVGPDQRIYPLGFIKPSAYSASKGAVISLTKYLATYWGERGIRVNCLVLGGVENGQSEDFIKLYSAKTPLRRMARIDEYNGMLLYLASEASSYSTGAIYVVDGGWTAW